MSYCNIVIPFYYDTIQRIVSWYYHNGGRGPVRQSPVRPSPVRQNMFARDNVRQTMFAQTMFNQNMLSNYIPFWTDIRSSVQLGCWNGKLITALYVL